MPIGRVRVVVKLAAIAVALIVCLAAHGAWRGLRRPSPWPRLLFKALAWIADIELRREGALAAPPVLLLANHLSWLDVVGIGSVSGSAFVAQDGLSEHMVLRALCVLNRTIFVDRESRGGIDGDTRKMRAILADGGVLTLFPEGTTNGGAALGRFKSSLLAAIFPPLPALAVQPLWLDYGSDAEDIAWVGVEPGKANLLRILARARPLTLTMHFLPALAVEDCVSRKTIAAAAHGAIDRVIRHGYSELAA